MNGITAIKGIMYNKPIRLKLFENVVVSKSKVHACGGSFSWNVCVVSGDKILYPVENIKDLSAKRGSSRVP
jgi:hypothetical protein